MKALHLSLILSASMSLTACLSGGDDSSTTDAGATTEKVRDPVESDCRTLGYSAVRSLVVDVMQVPESAMLSSGQTLGAFLTANQAVLGGTGASETRGCSILYFKAVAQLGMLSCNWAAENNGALLFPSGSGDVSTAYFSMTGKNLDSTEQDALTTLASQITTFDAGKNSSLESKRVSAVCSAIFASLASQTL